MNNGIFSSGSSWDVLFIGLFLCAITGYFLGSVNFAVIISRLKYKRDVRTSGSKNAGMTNMLRTYGKAAALLTLLGDVGKTLLSCYIGSIFLGEGGAYVAGLFCMIGHTKPIFFSFKGGKGVLTLMATVLYCNPVVCFILLTFFVIIVSCTKYISLGSIIFALFYPIVLSRFSEPNIIITVCSLISAVIVVVSHRKNIQRLRDGEENKIHLGKNGEFMKKGTLVLLNLFVIALTVGVVFSRIYTANGMGERRQEAAVCGEYSYSRLQMRYLYISCADEYLADEANGEEELVKNYDPNKKYCEQYLQSGESYADFFMSLAKQKATTLLCGKSAANAAALPAPSEYQINAYTQELDSAAESSGLDIAYYILDKYGRGMKKADITAVLTDECHTDLYLKSDAYSPDKLNSFDIEFDEKLLDEIKQEY